MLGWVTEGEVLLREEVIEGEVPLGGPEQEVHKGEAEGEFPQVEAEQVPVGEQEPFTAESDHGLSFTFGWQRSGHNCCCH